MIEKEQIGHKLRRESVKTYFDQIDINHTGLVKTEEFISALDKNESEDWLRDFFNSIHNFEVTSKSEIIIKKLKAIKENKNLEHDFKALDDLDW